MTSPAIPPGKYCTTTTEHSHLILTLKIIQYNIIHYNNQSITYKCGLDPIIPTTSKHVATVARKSSLSTDRNLKQNQTLGGPASTSLVGRIIVMMIIIRIIEKNNNNNVKKKKKHAV